MKGLSDCREGGNMKRHADTEEGVFSDEEIVLMYWNRDEAAIRATHEKYGKLVYRIVFDILHNAPDSEECQNDTYVGVWNRIPPTRPNVFPAFVAKIARGIAINRYKENTRKKRRPAEGIASLDDLQDSLELGVQDEAFDAEAVGEAISDYVRTLSDRRQFLFVGRFYMARSAEDLARELGVSVPTVYRELESIRQGLRRDLEGKGVYL